MLKASFLFLILLSILPWVVWAQHAASSTPETTESTIVLLVVPGQIVDSEDAAMAIRTQLDDLSVHLDVQRIPDDESATVDLAQRAREIGKSDRVTAVIWIDRENPTHFFFLTVREEGVDRFQRTIPSDTTVELIIENVAMMCGATVRALLAMDEPIASASQSSSINETATASALPTESVGSPLESLHDMPNNTPKVSPVTPPSQPQPVQKQRTPFWGINVGYAVHSKSKNNPAVHGFSAGLHSRIGKLGTVFATYEFRKSIGAKNSCVTTTVQAHPIRAGGNLKWPVGDFSLGPQVAFMLDYATRESYISPDCRQLTAFEDTPRFNGAITIEVAMEYNIHDRFHGFAALGADIFILQGRYAAPSETGFTDVLINPWKVQPVALIGVLVELI